MPLTFTQPRNTNSLASIDGFREVCQTLPTKGPLRMLRTTSTHPTVAALLITPGPTSTLRDPVPSQSLVEYVQAAVEWYSKTHANLNMRPQALITLNIRGIEDMQDGTLAAIGNQPASTPGQHGTSFL